MLINDQLEYRLVKPQAPLANYVESFWMLHNRSGQEKQVIGLPDGRIDLFFTQSDTQEFSVLLIGIGTKADQAVLPAHTRMFAISFKLPAVEYILRFPIDDLVNRAKPLPADFWGFNAAIMEHFELFCDSASKTILSLLPAELDERKRKLFELIYTTDGEMSVQELSEKSFWSSRQINRYFNEHFGISLKVFCSILRFRASLEHIVRGRLFPELNFADQNHFIKEVKKFSGALPKELFKNHNDRFILLSAIRQQ